MDFPSLESSQNSGSSCLSFSTYLRVSIYRLRELWGMIFMLEDEDFLCQVLGSWLLIFNFQLVTVVLGVVVCRAPSKSSCLETSSTKPASQKPPLTSWFLELFFGYVPASSTFVRWKWYGEKYKKYIAIWRGVTRKYMHIICCILVHYVQLGVSKNSGTPKSSILIGFSIIFTIHFGVPLFLETPSWT